MKKNKNKLAHNPYKLTLWFLAVSAVVVFAVNLAFDRTEVAKAAVTDAELLFNNATATVASGDDFNLVARVDPGSNDGTGGNPGVNVVELHIEYEPSVLQINTNGITVNATAFSSIDGYPTFNNTNGTADIWVYTSTPEVILTDVATISFHAVSAVTNSSVVFTTASNAAVNDGNGTLVVSTRTPSAVTITGSDTVAPIVTSFTIPSSYNNQTVPITTFTATDAVGVTGYCLTEVNDSAGCVWTGTAPANYAFGSSGSKTLYAWTKDADDNISTSLNDTVTIDTTLPEVSSVSSDLVDDTYHTVGEVIDLSVVFSEPVKTTGNVTVTLETGATDRTCTFQITADDENIGVCSYTVQAGDTTSDLDTNSIVGIIADAAGNVLTDFTPVTNLADNKNLIIDTTAPTGGSFTIDNDAAEATSTAVTLNVVCPIDGWATVQMAFGNTTAPTNWTTCAATTAHILASGNGSKTIYMRFRDGGQNATGDVTDTITLNLPDTTPPVLSGGFPGGALSAGTTQTTVSLVTDENATCKYSNILGVTYSAMDQTFTTTGGTSHSLLATNLTDGSNNSYFVRCQDANGNANLSDGLISFSVANLVVANSGGDSSSSSHNDKKKSTPSRTITNSKEKIKKGAILTQRGKKFSKKSVVLLYFSKYGGAYYSPVKIKTSSNGSFSVKYKVNKPKGTYYWYAVDTKTGKKSKTIHYHVKL